MKTYVLLGIVAFLVTPIWVLLAKAGCILRLLVRVETHPRTPLQAAPQVHSAATPSLRSGGENLLLRHRR
jgi:membrane glycosyltransferase